MNVLNAHLKHYLTAAIIVCKGLDVVLQVKPSTAGKRAGGAANRTPLQNLSNLQVPLHPIPTPFHHSLGLLLLADMLCLPLSHVCNCCNTFAITQMPVSCLFVCLLLKWQLQHYCICNRPMVSKAAGVFLHKVVFPHKQMRLCCLLYYCKSATAHMSTATINQSVTQPKLYAGKQHRFGPVSCWINRQLLSVC